MYAASPATLERAFREVSLLLIFMPNSFSRRTTSSSASTESSPKREDPKRGSLSGMSSGRMSSSLKVSTMRDLSLAIRGSDIQDLGQSLRDAEQFRADFAPSGA